MTLGSDPIEQFEKRHAICEATLAPFPFEERVEAVAEGGVDGYGVFHMLAPPEASGEDVRGALDRAGLSRSFAVPSPWTALPMRPFVPAAGRREIFGDEHADPVEAIIASLQWLAPVEPAAVILLPGPQGALSKTDAWSLAGERLQRIDVEAQRLGMAILLELSTPRFDPDVIESIDEARSMLDAIGSSNVKLLLDVFHIWELHDLEGQIARAAGQIGGVHLSDSSRFPRSVTDRLPAGQGVADVESILTMIDATGYAGWYESEVVSDDGSLGGHGFPDSWWRRSATEVVEACVRGFDKAAHPPSDGSIDQAS